MATIVTPDWDPTQLAVHREDLISRNGHSELSLLRHPSYPFLAEIAHDSSMLFAELRSVAEAYLTRVAPHDPSLAAALRLLKQEAPEGFGWLPITWDGPGGLVDPRGSFAVRRSQNGRELDRTFVLMAGNRSLARGVINGVHAIAVGLRVVMHADPAAKGQPVPIRVTGVSMCELGRASDGKPRAAKRIRGAKRRAAGTKTGAAEPVPALMDINTAVLIALVQQSLGFLDETVQLNGIEQVSQDVARVSGVGARPGSSGGGAPRGYLWSAEIGLGEGAPALLSFREHKQNTFAVTPKPRREPRLFNRDPASCGPARDIVERLPTHDRINRYREPVANLPQLLQDPDGRFDVLQSFIADPNNNPEDVQSINPFHLPLRSDHLSAAQAFLRARQFFQQLSAFRLPEKEYFKFARLPLVMRHRASFDAHPDGKAVMAQVRLVGNAMPFLGAYKEANRPQLEVAFGSAALRHREVHEDDHGRLSAQPLGIAADPRWAWHEFGHVLSYAATGALEWQFAHSMGDALAAVLNDPTSLLADDKSLYDGETFPWVPAGRRHDRDAAAGWCWCGRRNGQRHAPPTFPPLLYKGYVEEQMLSSSVFRFYRAIGGHPSNKEGTRKRAAAAAAYLLLRAALLLGPGGLVPARSADALVSAMVDADIGTRRPGDLFLGGCLHKVVRWAFERQGLFATDSPEQNVEGPGLPPAVDLWVTDRRPVKDGGYEPVTLEFPMDESELPWFAAGKDEGIWEDAGGKIHVVVRNRGEHDATGVAVRAWRAPAGSGALNWQYAGEEPLAEVPSRQYETAVITAEASNATHYLLVEVSAGDDRSKSGR